ncbi:protein of unknown function [Burkholderia multivorans]
MDISRSRVRGGNGYTSVHLWACRSFDARWDGHDVQQVRCSGDDGQAYWFNKDAVSNCSPYENEKFDLAIGQVNLYWHHYVLTRIVPTT